MLPNKKTVTMREIAEATGIPYGTLGTMRHNKKWPYNFPPLNKKTRGNGELLFDSGVIEAVKRKRSGVKSRQRKEIAAGSFYILPKDVMTAPKLPPPLVGGNDAPAVYTMKEVALKLIKANFDEAGLWLLKQQ